jgi:hypothetical protein
MSTRANPISLPTPAGATRCLLVVAFILRGLSVAGIVLLGNAPKYETPIEIVSGLLDVIITGAFGGAVTSAFAKDGTSGKARESPVKPGSREEGEDAAAGQDGAGGLCPMRFGRLGVLNGE